ncbi:hypothetical protein Amal_01380 [Acetobacter malorum]|uniref:Uncharacterized protein n=1 Tax=Acetobacter malorum TaxID=178901 RepID=A0A177GAT6_9PROT|nr:hypothetical protein Amal_01380 [Acetobacter malorum]
MLWGKLIVAQHSLAMLQVSLKSFYRLIQKSLLFKQDHILCFSLP